MNEVMTKVAKAIENLDFIYKEYQLTMDLGALKSIRETNELLQGALDNLCEDTK